MDQHSPSSAHYQALLTRFNQITEHGGGRFRISMMRVNRCLILRFEGEVAIFSSSDLLDRIRPVLNEAKGQACVIDLSLCDFLASSAIGFIAVVSMEIGRTGGGVYLVRPNEKISRMLSILGIDKVVTVVESVEAVIGE
ncbi:MAG: STAS domain-containing protein [Planctomycetota bacterium]